MSSVSARHAAFLLAGASVAGLILQLRATWPGFVSWQPQAVTFTPADAAGQSLVLELDHPSVVNFSAVFAQTLGSEAPQMLAQVTVDTPTRSVYPSQPVLVNRSLGQIQVRLDEIRADAGSQIVVTFADPNGDVLLGGSEHDSYGPGSRLTGDYAAGGDLAFRVFYNRSIGSLVLAGLQIAYQSRREVLALALVTVAAGLLISGVLRQLKVLDLGALLSAGMSGGLLLVSMIGLAAAMLRVHGTPLPMLLVALLLGLPGLWLWLRPKGLSFKPDSGALGLVACLLLFGALRLAFASPLVLPTHVDSVQEYLTVTDMLAPDRAALAANTIGDFSARYYHLGFHALAAWVLGLAGSSNPYSLLVLGQMIQAALIGSVYFPVYVATKDGHAALAAVALAGLGWSMPAYASNWAKYPALLGLTVLPVAFGLALLALQSRSRVRLWLLLASCAAVAGGTLIHTRMLFLFAGFALSIDAARRVTVLGRGRAFHSRTLIPLAIILLAAALSVVVALPPSLDSVRESLATFVDDQGAVSTVAVLVLLPLAFWRYRRAAMAAIASIGFILLFQLLPPNAPYPFPLIDMPLARMALFMPVCCLGGLGASGLVSSLRVARGRPSIGAFLRGAAVVGAGVYVGWSLTAQTYTPGDCCVLARPDDVAIAREASAMLPPDSLVLIPVQASTDIQSGPYPVDGGAWLFALAGRHTAEWPAEDDLASASQHSLLCSRGVTHVYVGGTPRGFSREELDLAPALYAPDLVLPGAAIYSVRDCG